MPVMKSTSLKLKGGKRKSFYNKNKCPRKSRHSKRKNTRRKIQEEDLNILKEENI